VTATAPPPGRLPRDPHYFRGMVLVVVAGVLMSIGGIGVRLIESAGAWQILFYRSLALIATLLVVLACRNRGAILAAFRAAGVPAVVAGLCLSFAFSGFIFSLAYTSVANTLFVLAAAPFLAAALGLLVLGEAVRRVTWLTMAVALVGVGTMVWEGVARGNPLGDLTALLSALGFAGFTVALRWGKTRDMQPAVCWAALFTVAAACLMIVLGGGAGRGGGFTISAWDLGLCAAMGAVQIGAGLLVYTAGSRYLPAAELALLALTEVVLGPIWVWLGVGETPSPATLLGGTIVLGAIAGNALSGLRRWRPPIGAV
jgi:DME family drug/metabolite transporter